MKVKSMRDLTELKDQLNNRLFALDVLELRYGPGETDRLAVKDKYNNSKFIKDHHFDDLLEIGKSNAFFKDRAKSFISEIASDLDIEIKFMYSQSIILTGDKQ